MSGYAKLVGDKIRGSGAIVPIGSTVLVMIVVGFVLWMQDNYSSYVAVRGMQVQYHRDGLGEFGNLLIDASIIAKAFLPQGVATVAFAVFLLMEPESRSEHIYRWSSLVIGVGAMIYDSHTGYKFYINPGVASSIWEGWGNPILRPYYTDALIHAIMYDAIGSEFLLSITVGIFGVIATDYAREMGKMMKALGELRRALTPAPISLPGRGNKKNKGRPNTAYNPTPMPGAPQNNQPKRAPRHAGRPGRRVSPLGGRPASVDIPMWDD